VYLTAGGPLYSVHNSDRDEQKKKKKKKGMNIKETTKGKSPWKDSETEMCSRLRENAGKTTRTKSIFRNYRIEAEC
jgi:hypothetical protein